MGRAPQVRPSERPKREHQAEDSPDRVPDGAPCRRAGDPSPGQHEENACTGLYSALREGKPKAKGVATERLERRHEQGHEALSEQGDGDDPERRFERGQVVRRGNRPRRGDQDQRRQAGAHQLQPQRLLEDSGALGEVASALGDEPGGREGDPEVRRCGEQSTDAQRKRVDPVAAGTEVADEKQRETADEERAREADCEREDGVSADAVGTATRGRPGAQLDSPIRLLRAIASMVGIIANKSQSCFL